MSFVFKFESLLLWTLILYCAGGCYLRFINFFDVTQDSEKEALGRNLREIPPPYEIYIQTRPEGMVYTYDKFNKKMANYKLIKSEKRTVIIE